MNALVALIVLAAIGFLALRLLQNEHAPDKTGDWPLYAKKVMTGREQELYWRLLQALPGQIILAQVALSQFVGIQKGHKAYPLRNRFDRKVADFVVCAKDASVIAVIELDDSSHEPEQRKAADAAKDKTLRSAGIRLVRWPAKVLPDIEQIRREIAPVIAPAVES